ncbi:hypothetical protein BDV38DRAFT_276429 [Aspergillus pseudotamarii]|uniref:Uncharacterized protein n=1 Tax=Aspergillus pseudotamarii TaxID=132259 RepID=A0A5N6SAI3_ASPPS|nr:uncharacterized protein BDV38DRAFT_276429 [Aspergillus pseudotamarii]KAE8130869.1 hypothetical protein BDV38DRAFT_276429 [Aspergillus pseudotamarii]
MACLNMSRHAKMPLWFKQFWSDRRRSVDLTDWNDGGQDMNSHSGDAAIGYDQLQSSSSKYQTPKLLTYEEGQPNLPVLTPTLRNDRPPTILTIGTTSSGETIALPSPPPRPALPLLPGELYDVIEAETKFGISIFTAYRDIRMREQRILFSARFQQTPFKDHIISCPIVICASHLAQNRRESLQRKLNAARELVPNSIWELFKVDQSASLIVFA